ncbi:MAG: hypothetical protein AB2728_04230 [Candidatus Thiodiazotropha sp.]|nr:hypothetical protein [Candidatus Thiodiazotropha taylori]MBT3058212.1 hypothetical protein [Candidatus Thiodiazotropha sp. (ex Lucina pensylvanica)]MBT3062796.1 hypothetical protein [Candidatus Thiodiazotropha sp. (ex Lucina pensylvanica)]MBV2094496.1 hypothetical protein [Candidatus Thiodiazotropha sp. (ex Codakia orbicularis)]
MTEAAVDIQRLSGYALMLMGFVLLFINHISVVAGDPWLIPEFLKLQ